MNIGKDGKNCKVNVHVRRLLKGLSGDFQVSRIKAKRETSASKHFDFDYDDSIFKW